MQKDISTNLRIPEEIWRAIKIRAAEEGKSMKELILQGISNVLGRKGTKTDESRKNNPLLEFLGKVKSDVTDGSAEHDKYIDDT